MKYALIVIMSITLISCGNAKSYTDEDNQAYQRLKDMVMARNFEIQSNFARPMATTAFRQVANTNILGAGNTATNIDITSNSNNLTIKSDTINGYFPYYGEQQFGGGYPGANHHGIEFNMVPDDYNVIANDDKHTVNINFKIDDQYRNNERYNVFITLFPNNRSNVQINSTNRSAIEYSGTVRPLKEDKMTQN